MRLRFANNSASVLGGKSARKKIVGRTYILPTIFVKETEILKVVGGCTAPHHLQNFEHFSRKTVEPIFFLGLPI